MRNRHTAAILERMNIGETIAETADEYISIAVELALNPKKRAELSHRIAQHKERLYNDGESVVGLERFLDSALAPAGQQARD